MFLVETDQLMKPGQPAVPPFVRARRQQRLVEHYWLCDDCATQYTLVYDREQGGVGLEPLRRRAASISNAAAVGSGAA